MYSKGQLAAKYFSYYLKASNGKGHGTHSPYVYDFIEQVLNDDRDFYAYSEIENLRKTLLKEERTIEVQDFGAGSALINTKQRKVADIARYSLKPKKYAQLLFRMVNYYQPKHILEIGTSLGITTCYLAKPGNNTKVTTMEGADSIAAIAQENFKKLALKNIELVQGNFNETLSSVIRQLSTLDFIFIDGNHRKEPTLRYFEQLLPLTHNDTILIFDDIHWSEEMEAAWKQIKKHEQVRTTIDLFFIGIVLLRKEFKEKQHFTIRF
ncbi:MAG: class I SAM-dependent methyltransferase [Sphingobacteriales bacterium]|nr:class I SAM-dependent methyltransferase [Sphingobacteriales bacterium]